MNPPHPERESIAIIGLAGRFPKAADVNAFWQNMCQGRECISFFSEAELETAGIEFPKKNPKFIKARGFLEDADKFDAAFFGISPREAEIMDPQHRLFLECSWEALEDAGYDSEREEKLIGVFAGSTINTYFITSLLANPELLENVNAYQLLLANDKDFFPTRVSYKLNLRGPSMTIQTACSTSLVAVCVACQNLLTWQCDMALAGGVAVTFPQKHNHLYQEGGIASPDGHCRAFDAKAQGTVPGEGLGIVVLKRLSEALADGDHIYSVIKGFGLNNDGSAKAGYTAPSETGQAEAISMALAMADFDPRTIGYVEAHGTATPLGDPIELAGLTRAFRAGTDARNYCAIGSVKTSIGHLDVAAGVAGLINATLALHHKLLPPSLNFDTPNPKIDFANSPFYVNTKPTRWPSNPGPRRAGVSSFGIGATNAHVVLEEAPAIDPSGPSRPAQLLVLSAKTASALDTATKNLLTYLKTLSVSPETAPAQLADLAYTLQVGRRSFPHRRALVCHSVAEAIAALQPFDLSDAVAGNGLPASEQSSSINGKQPSQVTPPLPGGEGRGEGERTTQSPQTPRIHHRIHEATKPSVAFLFPGQGAQRLFMGHQLYQTERVFRQHVDDCAEMLKPELGVDLRDIIYPPGGPSEPAKAQLKQTALTQPALFVIEYALARLWMTWGIEPAGMLGHSIGEYTAAALAGVFSLPDALRLVAARGRLMQSLPPGAMLALRMPEQEIRPLLNPNLSLAAVNGATQCVVSGSIADIDALQTHLSERGLMYHRLETSHGFHSPMVEPALERFAAIVRNVPLSPPQIPFISNVTGTWITSQQATDPHYWAQHMRQTVRFADGAAVLLKQSAVLLEAGPGRILSALTTQHAGKTSDHIIVSSLANSPDQTDTDAMLTALGQLLLAGVPVNWSGFYANERRHRISLPTYPFERKRHWIAPTSFPRYSETKEPAYSPSPDIVASAARTNPASFAIPSANGRETTTHLESAVQPAPSNGLFDPHTLIGSPSTKTELQLLFGKLLGSDLTAVNGATTFLEMGFDSLMLTQASRTIEKQFGTRVPFGHLLGKLCTFELLAVALDTARTSSAPSREKQSTSASGAAVPAVSPSVSPSKP